MNEYNPNNKIVLFHAGHIVFQKTVIPRMKTGYNTYKFSRFDYTLHLTTFFCVITALI